jgi:hypothetical protein
MAMFRMATARPQYALKPKELFKIPAGDHAASPDFAPICGFCYSFPSTREQGELSQGRVLTQGRVESWKDIRQGG